MKIRLGLKIIGGILLALFMVGVIAYLLLKPKDPVVELLKAADNPILTRRAKPGNILLKHVIVVDTKTGRLATNQNILIESGRIKLIFPGDSIVDAPASQIVEAAGKYVVPGYLNMHMHIIDQGDPSPELALMLASGITGFRQMSGSVELLKLRQEKRWPLQEYQPTMLSMPGPILTPVNTHNPEEAIENVRVQKAEGADFVKIGLLPTNLFFAVLSEARRVGIPALGHVPGDVDVAAASDSGFRSIEHLGLNYAALTACSTEESTLRTSAPKIPNILYHLPTFTDKLFMSLLETTLINPAVGTTKDEYNRINRLIASFSEAKARRIAAIYRSNDTWQCPTLSKLRSYQLAFLPEVRSHFGDMSHSLQKKYSTVTAKYEKQLTPEIKEEVLKAYQLELRIVQIYDSVGVKILAGTDNADGYTLWQEFTELAKAGLSPLHILQTATLNGAAFLDRRAEMGEVKAGSVADLVLLDGNPLQTVDNLQLIQAVIHSGYYFSKTDLETLRQQALQSLQNQ